MSNSVVQSIFHLPRSWYIAPLKSRFRKGVLYERANPIGSDYHAVVLLYRAMMMTPHVAALCSIQMREPTKAAAGASKFHVISKINTICILDCLARSAGAVLASIKANKAAAAAELEWETSKHTASAVFAQLGFCTAVQIRAQPLLGDLRPALIPIADSIIDTEYIPSGVFSNSAAHLVGWQRPAAVALGISHNALERERLKESAHRRRRRRRRDPNLILCNKDSRPLNWLSWF